MQDDQFAPRLPEWRTLNAAQRSALIWQLPRMARAARARAIGRAIHAAWRRLLRRQRRLNELGELQAMDDLSLRDIGISRLEIRAAIRSDTRLRSARRLA